jgi:hypothetical protein
MDEFTSYLNLTALTLANPAEITYPSPNVEDPPYFYEYVCAITNAPTMEKKCSIVQKIVRSTHMMAVRETMFLHKDDFCSKDLRNARINSRKTTYDNIEFQMRVRVFREQFSLALGNPVRTAEVVNNFLEEIDDTGRFVETLERKKKSTSLKWLLDETVVPPEIPVSFSFLSFFFYFYLTQPIDFFTPTLS